MNQYRVISPAYGVYCFVEAVDSDMAVIAAQMKGGSAYEHHAVKVERW
jgi:hypothetical protein